jgi:uncharacterized protein YifN (PemK superfamily)
MVYIVVKVYTETNETEIIEVVYTDESRSHLVAHDALINDALQYDINCHSIKNVSRNRIEVFKKTYFGNWLAYVYTIHDTEEEEETENKDKTIKMET